MQDASQHPLLRFERFPPVRGGEPVRGGAGQHGVSPSGVARSTLGGQVAGGDGIQHHASEPPLRR